METTNIMATIASQWSEILSNPLHSFFLIFSIILLEIILSVDNAAVLALMVKDLPKEQQNKALHYGIVGAYVFRGLALVFASFLVKFWIIKVLGGVYLLYLTYQFFKDKTNGEAETDVVDKDESKFYKFLRTFMSPLVSTIIMVEIMDIAFSVDNIFAVVAYTSNTLLIVFGVCVGILAMRYVANQFVKLIEKFPFLETCAYIVIGILGLKLVLSLLVHYIPGAKWIESETFDLIISGLTLATFFGPILYHKYKNKTATA